MFKQNNINYYIYVHRDKETTKKSNSFVATWKYCSLETNGFLRLSSISLNLLGKTLAFRLPYMLWLCSQWSLLFFLKHTYIYIYIYIYICISTFKKYNKRNLAVERTEKLGNSFLFFYWPWSSCAVQSTSIWENHLNIPQA